MTLIISLKTKYGFVMGADSRMTLNYDDGRPSWITDTYQKAYLAPNNIGVLVTGNLSSISGEPIMKALPDFLNRFHEQKLDIEMFSEEMHKASIKYFPKTRFLISGYMGDRQCIYAIHAEDGIADKSNYDIFYCGDIDIVSNLTNKSDYNIPYNHFTLEDGKEFVDFLFDVTKKTMAYQARKQTVGGSINRLIITPMKSYFVDKM